MREIKFRGKRIGCSPEHGGNGEWVYGYYVVESYDGRHPRIPAYEKHRIYTGEVAYQAMAPPEMARYLVDPATVGQYTGLKDKNGQEIYEGDIMQTFFSFAPGDAGYGVSQRPFVVKWEQGRTGFRAFKPQANGRHLPHLLDIIDFFEMQAKLYEVIGNIYENPELLKEDNHA